MGILLYNNGAEAEISMHDYLDTILGLMIKNISCVKHSAGYVLPE